MQFAFSYSPAWLLLIVPLAAALTWWLYRNTGEMLRPWVRNMLAAFRFTVLVLLMLLLLEPLLTSLNKLKYPPTIAVLQDVSESMVLHRDSSFVRKEYPGLLRNFLNAWDEDDYSVEGYTFAGALRPGLSPDSLRYTAEGTDIASALTDVHERYQGQNLGAIVLVSDGIPTSGASPLFAVEGIRQPIFTVLIGDTARQRDVRLRDALYNEIAYLNNETPIRVKVEAEGYDAADLTVTLRSGSKTWGSQQVNLTAAKSSAEVSFLVKPEKVGMQEFLLEVSRKEGEVTYRNNILRLFINVLESRVKIGIFAGSPHPDLGALKDAFRRENAYDVFDFTLKQPGTYYEDPAQVNLSDVDLFIFHNYPQSSADAPMVKRIVTEVEKRNVPCMFFVGTFTNLQVMQPLYAHMAITPKTFNTKSAEVILNFKEEYTRHATYTFAPDWIRWINATPPIYRNSSIWEAKPNAQVFATAKIKNIPLDYPVYALQEYLGRKNMTFLGENFWRLRASSYVEHESFDYFDDWVFSNIKWLMAQSDKRKFKVTPSRQFYSGDEPVFFRGEAYNDSYDPLPGVDIKLSLTGPDGKAQDYFFSEAAKGQYALEVYNLPEGAYTYKATGRKDNALVGTDEGTFSIGRSNIEHFNLRADKGMLQQLALRTGGQFIVARDLGELDEKIKALQTLKPVVDFRKERRDFHRYWWIMALLLGLLSTEWIVRKVNSLL